MATMSAPSTGWLRASIGTGITIATALVLLALGWQTFRPTIELPNPVETQRTVVEAPAVLRQMDDLAAFTAARSQYQVVVELEESHGILPTMVAGQSATLLATGEVEASVDFSDLGPDRVRIGADGTTATITLPEPQLSEARIDFDASRVVARERGAVDRLVGVFDDNTLSETELYALASDQIERAAADSALAVHAERNTRAMLTELLAPVGVERVYLTFEREAATAWQFDLRGEPRQPLQPSTP